MTTQSDGETSSGVPSPGVLFQIDYGTRDEESRAQVHSGLCLDQLIESLDSLAGSEEVTEIDLTQVTPILNNCENWNALVVRILKLLQKSQLKKLIFEDKIVNKVVGNCKGYVSVMMKSKFGDEIQLEENLKMKVRDVIDISTLTNKVVGLNSDHCGYDRVDTAIDVLNDIAKLPTHPPTLITGIAKAYKFIRKKLRVDRKDMSKMKRDSSKKNKIKESQAEDSGSETLTYTSKTKSCHICRERFRTAEKANPATAQYPCLCPLCAQFNLVKRNQRGDLSGRVAVVTGGRIKIGYETVVKLLRDSCVVITTTRFPNDAAKRFSAEPDFHLWSHNLTIYPLDLKDMTGIHTFVSYLKETVTHIDIVINNAAQTLRRPKKFYQHLMAYEQKSRDSLPSNQRNLLAKLNDIAYNAEQNFLTMAPEGQLLSSSSSSGKNISHVYCDEYDDTGEPPTKRFKHNDEKLAIIQTEQTPDPTPGTTLEQTPDPTPGTTLEQTPDPTPGTTLEQTPDPSPGTTLEQTPDSFPGTTLEQTPDPTPGTTLEQTPYPTPGTISEGTSFPGDQEMDEIDNASFPEGLIDCHGQQIDLRKTNSWTKVLDNVPLSEMLEVLMVNTVAPFILNKELKPLLTQSPHAKRFIVNVSAMEGQFNRKFKTKFHPHTNMAKAALNMMTRTSALGYVDAGVYMTAVDTGWVTDERPFSQAQHERSTKGFRLPLDTVDGAARVLDPIYSGIANDITPHFAVFLKNYHPHPW